jgi:hypothetical protein
MPIMVYRVAEIIDGEIVFSPFAKKTVPGMMRVKGVPVLTFGDVAESALLELHAPAPPPAPPHILWRPPRPKNPKLIFPSYTIT